MWLVQSGKSFATCASTAVRKAAMSSPSFSSTKTMPLPSRSARYFAAVSLSQASVLRPISVITSSMILVDEGREHRLHVAGQHDVFLPLVELEVVDVRQRVLLADDEPGGERGRELRDLDRRRDGAHAGQHRRPQLDRHAAVLLA